MVKSYQQHYSYYSASLLRSIKTGLTTMTPQFNNSSRRKTLPRLPSSEIHLPSHCIRNGKIDYCNAVFAAAPKTATEKLQRVLNAAARLINDTQKYDQGLSRLMHHDLHWLDIPERVSYELCLLTNRCLLGKVPMYLSDYLHQYPKLLHDSTCVQPLVTGWWFRDIGSARTAVGHSLSLAR